MSEPAKSSAELEAAENAADEAWKEWKAAASQNKQDKDAFLKRYNDLQGKVESLRPRMSSHGASNCRVHCLCLFFVCQQLLLSLNLASLGTRRSSYRWFLALYR